MWHTLSRSRRATIKRLSLLFIMLAGVGVAVDKVRAPARRTIALSAVPRITVSRARATLRGAAGPRAHDRVHDPRVATPNPSRTSSRVLAPDPRPPVPRVRPYGYPSHRTHHPPRRR